MQQQQADAKSCKLGWEGGSTASKRKEAARSDKLDDPHGADICDVSMETPVVVSSSIKHRQEQTLLESKL